MQHHKIRHKLKKKGWEKHYVDKTLHILKKAEKKKPKHIKRLDNLLHLILLGVILLGTVIIMFAILPILINLPGWLIGLVVFILGLSFGFFVDNELRDTELSHKHYILSGILISGIATGALFLALDFAKGKLKELGIFVSVNPLLILFSYFVGFSLPHIFYKIKEHSKK